MKRRARRTAWIILAAFFFLHPMLQAQTYTSFDIPGVDGSTIAPRSVSGNYVAGYYADGNGLTHAFLYDISSGVETQLVPPGSNGVNTLANCVDGNNVVVLYTDSNGLDQTDIYNIGTGAYSSGPVPPGSTEAGVLLISGNNMVGASENGQGVQQAFFYNGSSFTTLDPPSSSSANYATEVDAMDGNTVLGNYGDIGESIDIDEIGTNNEYGFLFNGGNGAYTTINYPGANWTYITGVSGNTVVGEYYATTNTTAGVHSFLYNIGTGAYTSLDPLGSLGSIGSAAEAISGNTVVGGYTTTGPELIYSKAFLYNISTGAAKAVGPPGSQSTTLTAISGNYVAGQYEDSGGVYHGLVVNLAGSATPEPFSGYSSGANGEYYSPWFGFYNNAYYPFIYRSDLGFIYVYTSDDANYYLYVFNGNGGRSMGWIYTSQPFYPFVYDFSESAFLYFAGGTSFYNYATSGWETY